MLARILISGLIGGIAGGLVVAAIQAVTTTPLILQAETFETARALDAVSLIPVHDQAKPAAEGLNVSRLVTSSIATIAVATGYTFLLLGGMLAAGRSITARTVFPWAMAGFAATGLAPALGMAPELPGAASADVGARQLWWIGTALATGAGLAAMAFGRGALWVVAGICLGVLPHLIGAPAPPAPSSKVPAEMAAQFAAASITIQALVWLIPAAIAGVAISRMQGIGTTAGEPSA
ncbi:MAG: CbtA family protein [Bauldia litoralis]